MHLVKVCSFITVFSASITFLFHIYGFKLSKKQIRLDASPTENRADKTMETILPNIGRFVSSKEYYKKLCELDRYVICYLIFVIEQRLTYENIVTCTYIDNNLTFLIEFELEIFMILILNARQ